MNNKMKITEQQYKDALKLINQYRSQREMIPHYAVRSELHPNYFVSKRGEVWNESGQKKVIQIKTNKIGRKQCRVNINGNTIALASIIASQFCVQPNNHTRLIFKDNNPLNCNADNLVWVTNEISYLNTKIKYPERCPMGKGGKPLKEDAAIAATKATDPLLKKYYLSGNEKYLQQCWKKIDSEIQMKFWDEVKSECYIYFMDRCKRNSIFGNPIAYFIIVAQKKIKEYKKTLNTALAQDAKKLDSELIRRW